MLYLTIYEEDKRHWERNSLNLKSARKSNNLPPLKNGILLDSIPAGGLECIGNQNIKIASTSHVVYYDLVNGG